MKKLISECKRWIESHPYAPLTIVRIYLGLGLLIKGVFFLQNREVLDTMLQAAKLPTLPLAAATYVIWAHILGGVCLAAGLGTRLAALAQMPIFYGAIAYAYVGHLDNFETRQRFEFASLMFFLSGLVMLFGAGPRSLDRLVFGRWFQRSWVEEHPDAFLDLIRMFLGVALFLKGAFFMTHREHLLEVMNRAGTWSIIPITLAHYVIPAHFVGGIMLAGGIVSRLAALAQLPILAMAVFYVHLPNYMAIEGRQNLEFTALVLVLTLVVLAFGSGRWAIEHARNHEPEGPLETRPIS